MRDIMYHQSNSPRLTDVKDTNIFALLSPKNIRRQRSLTTPIDLEKSTSVPNFPPILRTQNDGQDGHLRNSMDDVMPTAGDSIRHLYLPQKPRSPRPGTPTFNSPFFRRRALTHPNNPLDKRVHSEPAMDISLLDRLNEQRKGLTRLQSPSLGSRPASRTLSRPKLRASISSSTHESTSNVSTEELNLSTELVPQGKLGSHHHARQHFHFTNRFEQQDDPGQFVPDASSTHDRIIEADELMLDKITDLPTKDLVDKCQKWLEGVAQAKD